MSLKLYLAGPDVFRSEEGIATTFTQLKQLAEQYGFIGCSPLDTNLDEISRNPHAVNEKRALGEAIFVGNDRLLQECDVIIANLVPFRGACADDGTSWELGCGFAHGKRLYGYTPYAHTPFPERVKKYYPTAGETEFPEVEDFDGHENLMLEYSILHSGGILAPTFEDCLKHLRDNPPV